MDAEMLSKLQSAVGSGDEEKVPEEENTPTETEETEPGDDEPDPEPEVEPSFDIPEVGKLKLSEIKEMRAAQERIKASGLDETDLDSRMEELNQREAKLEEARTLNDLLEIPELRQRVLAVIEEMAEGKNLSAKDGQRPDLSKFRDSRMDEFMEEIKGIRQFVASQQEEVIISKIDAMRDDFKAKFPDVIDDASWKDIVTDAAKLKGKALDFTDIENMAYRRVVEKGGVETRAKKAAQEAIKDMVGKKLPNGATVVVKTTDSKPSAASTTERPKIRNFNDMLAALKSGGVV